MIRFIIVDDDREEIKHIRELLDETVKTEKEVLSFTKLSNDLKQEINDLAIRKIYILDIELGNKVSGINIAKLIRDVDWESEIIFITNHDKMFESVHRTVYEVFDFIEKFHEFDKRFKRDIKEILRRNFDNKMFIYKVGSVEVNLYYKYILYIYRETEDRKLVIVMDANTYTLNISIKEMLSYLDDRFIQCHRSCIVNTGRVQIWNYKDGYFVLDNGNKVYMLSKKYKKDIDYD